MKRALICLLIGLLILIAVACKVDGNPGGGWKPTEGSPLDGAHATETYAAGQWHAQLTAIAETPEP